MFNMSKGVKEKFSNRSGERYMGARLDLPKLGF